MVPCKGSLGGTVEIPVVRPGVDRSVLTDDKIGRKVSVITGKSDLYNTYPYLYFIQVRIRIHEII